MGRARPRARGLTRLPRRELRPDPGFLSPRRQVRPAAARRHRRTARCPPAVPHRHRHHLARPPRRTHDRTRLLTRSPDRGAANSGAGRGGGGFRPSRTCTTRSRCSARSGSISSTPVSARCAGYRTSAGGHERSPTCCGRAGRLFIREFHPMMWTLDRSAPTTCWSSSTRTSRRPSPTWTKTTGPTSRRIRPSPTTRRHTWNHGLGRDRRRTTRCRHGAHCV